MWADVKANYNEKAWSFGSLLSGIEDFENEKAQEKLQYAEMLKNSVNQTLAKSHKEFGKAIDSYLNAIESESKRMGNLEKETEKRYKEFSQILTEAESLMAKDQLFEKDFWIYENNFIKSAEFQLKHH